VVRAELQGRLLCCSLVRFHPLDLSAKEGFWHRLSSRAFPDKWGSSIVCPLQVDSGARSISVLLPRLHIFLRSKNPGLDSWIGWNWKSCMIVIRITILVISCVMEVSSSYIHILYLYYNLLLIYDIWRKRNLNAGNDLMGIVRCLC
jgi:hypothetical protein